jgi:multiple sugar transport system substrate-binding protein
MEPLIGGPPFERALKELVACRALDPDGDAASGTPESARQAVLSGRAAMALTWPSGGTTDAAAANVPEGARFGFAPLPGSATVYNFAEENWTPRAEDARRVPCLGVAGRLGSLTRNARRPREVAGILALLSSREWSPDISPHSAATTLFRRSHVRQPSVWTDPVLPEDASRQYAELVEQVQSSPVYFFTVRIPGWRRYLAALDHAVAQACGGAVTPAEALAQAASTWNAITQELGLDAQRTAYTRSLGLAP